MPTGSYPQGFQAPAQVWSSRPSLAVTGITFLTVLYPISATTLPPAGKSAQGVRHVADAGISGQISWTCRRRDIGALDKAFPRPDTAGTIGSILSWSSALSARAAMTFEGGCRWHEKIRVPR
jgi:hypothetical protein